jgi:hypothetical protein
MVVFAGKDVNTGLPLSTTVMRWEMERVLLQLSEAVQRRVSV